MTRLQAITTATRMRNLNINLRSDLNGHLGKFRIKIEELRKNYYTVNLMARNPEDNLYAPDRWLKSTKRSCYITHNSVEGIVIHFS